MLAFVGLTELRSSVNIFASRHVLNGPTKRTTAAAPLSDHHCWPNFCYIQESAGVDFVETSDLVVS